MTPFKRDSDHHTYADYVLWSRTYGDELINGAAYVKEPPAPSPSHQAIVLELALQLTVALEGKPCRVYVAPFDVRLPKSIEEDDQVDTVVQPDVLIVADPRRVDGRGLRGPPDWLAEVLSPSTASYDQVVKLPVYERAGVSEVWLIHPSDQTLSIYRLEAGSYGRPMIHELAGNIQLTAIPDIILDCDRIRNKI